MGGDFNMAVNGPVADVSSDAEFMAPGSIPLWGAGGLEGGQHRLHGFPMVPLVRQQTRGPHVFPTTSWDSMRDESTHYPVFMHLWVAPERHYEATQLNRDVS